MYGTRDCEIAVRSEMFAGEKQRRSSTAPPPIEKGFRANYHVALRLITTFDCWSRYPPIYRNAAQPSQLLLFLVFSSNFLHSTPLFHSHRRVRMHFLFAAALTHILNITKTISVRFSLSSLYSSNFAVFSQTFIYCTVREIGADARGSETKLIVVGKRSNRVWKRKH